jgi:hypothetical protein
LNDEWDMRMLQEGRSDDDSYKEGEEILAFHERAR